MASLSFLYALLPLFFALFLLAPRRARPVVLLALSLAFYALVQPVFLTLMLVVVAMDWGAMLVMAQFDTSERVRRACVWFSVVKNIGIIFFTSAVVQLRGVEAVLGTLVYTLSGISAVLERYQRKAPPEINPIPFFVYCCFFPRLFAGPLTPYREFRPQLDALRAEPWRALAGFGLFVQGAVKCRILGLSLQAVYESLRGYAESDPSVVGAWMLVFAFALSLYFRYSGLCDMARGLGRMFGLELPQNFYYPYQSQSVNDFFHRFNITVAKFIRGTVYTGLQEDQNGPLADTLNTLVICMLMGLWFGFRVNYLVWGIYLALFMLGERYLYPAVLQNTPTLFARLYALCVVLSSFTILEGSTLLQSVRTIGRMFSFGLLPLTTDALLYLLGSNWLLLVVSCLFATSLFALPLSWARRTAPRVTAVAMSAVNLGLLGLLTAMLIG